MTLPTLEPAEHVDHQRELASQPVARRAQAWIADRHAFGLTQGRARVVEHVLFLLLRCPAQQIDDALDFERGQAIPSRGAQHGRLVARGQPRQLSRQARRHQAQTQLRLGFGPQPFQECQSPAHPTLMLVQQLRRFHLRQPVFTHQGLHDPGFLQLTRLLTRMVEPEDRRLGRPLIDIDQPHAQRRPPDLSRGRVPLEPIEQFGLAVPPARRHWGQLPIRTERPGHRRLGRRVRQSVATIPRAQLRQGQRPGFDGRDGGQGFSSPTPQREGTGGPGVPEPTRCLLRLGGRSDHPQRSASIQSLKTSRRPRRRRRRATTRRSIPRPSTLPIAGFPIQHVA